ncbi:MAG: hypothetical protein Q9220_001742 [cf. Caloplaca sp. 1 TL-2023]
MDHPKKRRRRRKVNRLPVPAKLVSDKALGGGKCLLSASLYRQLFPWETAQGNDSSESQLQYIAITPWSPQSLDAYRELSWTILPIRIEQPEEHDEEATPTPTIRYPLSSTRLQNLFRRFWSASSSHHSNQGGSSIRILVVDVEPIQLDAVYVSVDGNALEKHGQIQKEYGGGFNGNLNHGRQNNVKGKGRETVSNNTNGMEEKNIKQQEEDELIAAVRSSLSSCQITRRGDAFPLPLPAHPITHVPLPPFKIILCEPINQGLLSPETQIVVVSSKRAGKAQVWSHRYNRITGDDDETSNEQFYSAAESGVGGCGAEEEQEDEMSEPSSPDKESTSDLDESEDNIISLNSPGLVTQRTGINSASVASPGYGGLAKNGTGTPASVISNLTAHQHSERGKVFQACSLLTPVPDHLLHPITCKEDDDECRIYIDIQALLKIKCFSGDWVHVRTVTSHGDHNRSFDHNKRWDLQGFSDDPDCQGKSRFVRVYGLPEISSRSSMRYLSKSMPLSSRRSSTASSSPFHRPHSQAWLSPTLLANLDNPEEIRLVPYSQNNSTDHPFSPIHTSTNFRHSQGPPVATEVNLAKISTPLSQETPMQEHIFLRLKQYFQSRQRNILVGDILAVKVDIGIGRGFGAAQETAKDTDDLLSLLDQSQSNTSSTDVVWFKVVWVGQPPSNEGRGSWDGAVRVDPAKTRMTMGTTYQCRVPSALRSTWRYYLGLQPRTPTHRDISPMNLCMSTLPVPYVSTLRRRLRELIAAATSSRAVRLDVKPTMILLHSNQRNIGKVRAATHAALDLGIHTFLIDAYDIISEGNAGDIQENSFNTRIARAMSCGAQYTTLLVSHIEALTSNRLITALQKAAKDVRILIATTTQLDQVSEKLRSLFTHEIEMSAPDEGEREGILRNIIEGQGVQISHDVDLKAIAVKTAALVAGNLVDIVERATIARQQRLESMRDTQSLIRDIEVSGGERARCVIKADFDLAVEAARKNFADAIGAPKIPNVGWDDVGGLENVKDAVMETIQLPLERPELFAKGMKKRSGILFYGPPGTGKTLLAKAIATEFSLNFFSVKGPELLNMYIGESEANVRRVFQRARDARPCVVFFDELDSVAPKRGNQGDSGGVMDRIVSQLLAELDGMSDGDDGGGGVFVIGATNRPDLLDQALLRPGRFDKMLYLGISDTHQKQLTIMEALTRKFSLDPNLSLGRVATSLPFTYTGADLYALCSDAMLKAITRQASAVDAKIRALPNGPVTTAYFFDHFATKEDIAVTVTEKDFEAARRELVGSVSAKELEHYQRVRQSFEAPSIPPPSTSTPASTRPSTNDTQHPMPTRPKYKTRTNTAIKSHPKAPLSDPKGKGKGKAPQKISSSESDDDDDDEAYVTSNDFAYKSAERMGKQKATMIPKPVDGFRDPAVGDEEMYR